MSRIVKILIMAILLSPVGEPSALAAEVIQVPSNPVVVIGDTISVDITISLDAMAGEQLAGGGIDLAYDDSVIEILSVTIDPIWDFLPESGSKTGPGLWEGVGFDVFNNDYVSGNAIIVSVELEAVAAGTSALSVLPSSQFFSHSAKVFPSIRDASIRVNTPPVADDQAVNTNEDAALAITLTGGDADGDTPTFAVVIGPDPAKGTLSGTAPNLTYTPNGDFNGPDSFTFQVNDGNVDSNIATVSITVNPLNDPPEAIDLAVTTNEDATVALILVGGDVDGDTVSYKVAKDPANGTLSGSAPNLTYTPNGDFNGSDSFTFQVNDGNVDSNIAMALITVNAVNDAPVVENDTATTNEDAALVISGAGLLSNDTDVDGDTLSIINFSAPINGTLVYNGDGTYTYTPGADFNGNDYLLYEVSDGNGGVGTATVTINITPQNDAPEAVNDTANTIEDTPLIIAVLANDSDEDGDGISLTGVAQASNGTVMVNGDNTVTYTPNAGFKGQDSFTYDISDGQGGSDTATVSVNVYAGQFTLSWEALELPEVAGYFVQVGTAPRDYSQTIDVGNVTSYDIWLAEKLVSYYFSVTAYDSDGLEIDFFKPEISARVRDDNYIETATNYEDAWSGTVSGWTVYDNDPAGAVIANVDDMDRGSRVIALSGSGISNGFSLKNEGGSLWHDSNQFVVAWSLQYSEYFYVYLDVETSAGHRYIYYTPDDDDLLGNAGMLHHGLGSGVMDGQWHTIVRDLQGDLEHAQPGVSIVEVNGFLIRGSGRVDDIKLLSDMPASWDTDGDGIADVEERGVYGTDPYTIDSDGDGVGDGDELTFWGNDWSIDYDGDGLNNLLDIDSDNDSVLDDSEIVQGSDPGNNGSIPSPNVYEDAEDGTTDGWDVYDASLAGALISNVFNQDRQSRVIELSGSGTSNGFRLRNDDGSPWLNSSQFVVEWSMQYSENFYVYLDVETTAGHRYIYYTPDDNNLLGSAGLVHHGLGSNVIDGQWHTFVRDLRVDLEDAQPGVSIIEVNAFLIRGSGNLDDIKFRDDIKLYETAEDGTTGGWVVYDPDPVGAEITNVYDTDRRSLVIELAGSGISNGFELINSDDSLWLNTSQFVVEWSMQYSEYFYVYLDVETTAGHRYIYYTPDDNNLLGSAGLVHHGLGSNVIDGQWHTFVRDLRVDLEDAQPGVRILEVNAFLIRGSGRVDDIALRKDMPANSDSDGDGIADIEEISIYGTDPKSMDTDKDGLDDGDELTYWGNTWDVDYDGDGLNNLRDIDSDNDGASDGSELVEGSDPGDNRSIPPQTVYEDAEDDSTDGWDIYDYDPAGAMISNVFDDDRQSWVIEFAGLGISNGFRLRHSDGSPWRNSSLLVIEWSMQYSESFKVYLDVETTAGQRYIYYTPDDDDLLGNSGLVHHGLGSDVIDGGWHTFVRDLQADLEEAQSGVDILEVNAFLIRGSGRVDDIKLLKNAF